MNSKWIKKYSFLDNDDIIQLSPHFFLPHPLINALISFPFVCFFTSAAFSTHFVQFPLFLVLSLLCHMFTLLPQRTKQQPTLLTLVFFMFYPSIHLSITPAEPLSQSLSLSLASPCCGLCLQSLSDLLSLLSAPLVRTKSSSAHGTTKDKGRNKRKEP